MSRRFFQTQLLCFALLICPFSFPAIVVPAQTVTGASKAPSSPAFDIVAIHPMKEGDDTPANIANYPRSGYFKAVHVNVKALMEVAYDIPDLRMFGGPAWLTTEKFSIEAKADPKLDEQIAALPPDQARQLKRKMLSALLVERFKLAEHTEMREMPVYSMIVLKGGPRGSSESGNKQAPTGDNRVYVVAGGSNSLEVLAYELSWRLGRPVLDRTGLQDRQALRLVWRDDEGTSDDSNAPSLFTAIQEQLGLKLEPARARVPVLMIDHAEKPTEN